MEHEWGRNITEFGLGTIGFAAGVFWSKEPTIASRIIAGPLTDWWLLNSRFGTLRLIARVLPGTEVYSFGGVNPPNPVAAHFPYGFAVVPDAPV